jgi:hypothetical protein
MSLSPESVAHLERDVVSLQLRQATLTAALREAASAITVEKRKVDNLQLVIDGKCWWGGCVLPRRRGGKATFDDHLNRKEAEKRLDTAKAVFNECFASYQRNCDQLASNEILFRLVHEEVERSRGDPLMTAAEVASMQASVLELMDERGKAARATREYADVLRKAEEGQVKEAMASMELMMHAREKAMEEHFNHHFAGGGGGGMGQGKDGGPSLSS